MNAKSVTARRFLGQLYASQGQVTEALEQWKEALALDPDNIPTLIGYGVYLANLRPGTDALEFVRKAYELDPDDPDAIDAYARVAYLEGHLGEARKIIQKGGDYFKGNPSFEKHRAMVLSGR